MRRSPRSLLRAQAQALAILGTTLTFPGASALARAGRQPPRRDDCRRHHDARSSGPPSAPPWPALVFMNGATPDGRRHPTVHRLSLALARTGHLRLHPGPAGHRRRRAVAGNARQRVAFTQAASRIARSRRGRVALVGVSVGGTLALLAAADATLADADLGRRRASRPSPISPR